MQHLLALEPQPRNRVLLRLLYAGGLHMSELCGLTLGDIQARGEAGQVLVHGKRGKTRAALAARATGSARNQAAVAIIQGRRQTKSQ